MLTSALRRHIHHRSFKQLQQSLLHSFAANITCNRRIIALTGNLVYLVDKNNTTFCSCYIIIGNLQQARQNALDILAYVTCLGKNSCIDNRERHIEQSGYRTCQQGFPRSGTTHHDNVALFYLYSIFILGLLQTLIMVVNRYRKVTFRLILSDDILVEICLNVLGLRYFLQFERLIIAFLTVSGSIEYARRKNDLISLLYTVFTDKPAKSRYQQPYLVLASATEAAYFLWHFYFFRVSTASIIPYSFASSAVIQ